MFVSDVIAIVRFFLLVCTIALSLKLYDKLPFRGFQSLAIAFTFRLATFIVIETGFINPTGTIAQIFLIITTLLFLMSAYLIYRAAVEFGKESS